MQLIPHVKTTLQSSFPPSSTQHGFSQGCRERRWETMLVAHPESCLPVPGSLPRHCRQKSFSSRSQLGSAPLLHSSPFPRGGWGLRGSRLNLMD